MNDGRCTAKVWASGSWHPHRCNRKAQPGKDCCKQHDPELRAARDAARTAERDRTLRLPDKRAAVAALRAWAKEQGLPDHSFTLNFDGFLGLTLDAAQALTLALKLSTCGCAPDGSNPCSSWPECSGPRGQV